MRFGAFTLFLISVFSSAGLCQGVLSGRPRWDGVLTLEEAVQIALKESPFIRGAEAEWRAAQQRIFTALAERKFQSSLSVFSGTGRATPILSSPESVTPIHWTSGPGRSFSTVMVAGMWTLYSGRRLESLVDQARLLEKASQADKEAVRLRVALETRLAFRKALLAHELVTVAEAHLRALEELVRVDRERAQVGKIPEFWVLRSEAEMATAQQGLVSAKKDLEIALINLKALMGVHPDSSVSVKGDLASEKISLSRSQLLELALRERPEVLAASFRFQSHLKALSAAKALYRPQISLMVVTERMWGSGTVPSTNAFIGLVAAVPISDGGRRKSLIKEQELVSEKARYEQDQIILTVVAEVDAALRELEAAAQNVTTAQTALKAAEKEFRVATVRYEAGRSILVEYLDSLSSYVRAQTNLAVALYEQATAFDRLLKATGRLADARGILSR
ncbi:MAG: TolC family protein [Armatimonadetes bacterium]|nr:TolC family protein [Armatimonadota bacterium]MDW8121021.1 TolC family protein [Armatimonadota bacterium]